MGHGTFISLRTKEALAAKHTQGISLGKPKGTIQKSQFGLLPRSPNSLHHFA
ncbi:MAG TPA: hypothetical protein VGL94_08765 [Ktedonobacteraceae bacterium]|jgi:hypothetical protein